MKHNFSDSLQAHLAAIIESSDDAIISKDLNGNIVSWNAGAQRMFGYTAAEAIGQSIRILAVPQRMNEMPTILERISRGERVEPFETERKRKDGRIINVSVTVSPILTADGVIIGASKIARDITERKRAETALHAANAALKRINDDLREFAYAASHDLQEPLRIVGIYAQLLLSRYNESFDPKAAELLGFIRTGATRMQTLVSDLSEFTLAGDTLDDPLESVDCQRVLELSLKALPEYNADIPSALKHSSLPTVIAHEEPLVSLFRHLIGNALKYRRPDLPPQVHISADTKGEDWIFSFRDNGIGISPAYHKTIFGVFKRLHRDEYPGTGIGLAICSRVVERYGGSIWVESEAGQGSTFYFTLPVSGPIVHSSAVA
jgi:PAS domain S-box-containing protein